MSPIMVEVKGNMCYMEISLPSMKRMERYYKILIQHFVAARTIILLSVIPGLFVDDNGSKDRAGKI